MKFLVDNGQGLWYTYWGVPEPTNLPCADYDFKPCDCSALTWVIHNTLMFDRAMVELAGWDLRESLRQLEAEVQSVPGVRWG